MTTNCWFPSNYLAKLDYLISKNLRLVIFSPKSNVLFVNRTFSWHWTTDLGITNKYLHCSTIVGLIHKISSPLFCNLRISICQFGTFVPIFDANAMFCTYVVFCSERNYQQKYCKVFWWGSTKSLKSRSSSSPVK